MDTKDIGKEYKKLCKEIEIMLSNIREIGVNVEEYKSELENIKAKINRKSIEIQNTKNMAIGSREANYTDGTYQLKELKKKIEKYDIYYKILNSCSFIEMKLKNKDIEIDELNQYITKIIYNFKSVLKHEIEDNEIKKQIEERLYKAAYELIKKEILIKGESNIYLFCKNEDVDITYFDNLIREEIESLNANDNNYELLRTKIYEIKSKGITANYFDIELIKILLTYNNDYNLDKSITNKLKAMIKDMEKSSAIIRNQQLNKDMDELNAKEKNVKNKKTKIKVKIGSLALLVSIIISGGFAIKNQCKKSAHMEEYTKTSEIYSTIDGKTKTTEEKVLEKKTNPPREEEVFIKRYQEYNGESSREYEYIDVSNYDFEELEDYYEYGFENYNLVPRVSTDRSVESKKGSNYQGTYIEVERNTYKDEGPVYSKKEYITSLSLALFGYIMTLLVIEGIYKSETEDTIILGNIEILLKEIEQLKESDKEYQDIKEQVEKKLNEIRYEIDKYEELKERFNELYEENKYLLDDEKELLKRYKEISEKTDVIEVKRIVKKIKI